VKKVFRALFIISIMGLMLDPVVDPATAERIVGIITGLVL